ncbi:MAG: hypothetical protein MUF03_05715 [Rubrivivax sp.]|nr:hypothetical protein [Rubrivivax sp.]
MNAITQEQQGALELVEIIDLKWLLAREGHHVHVERVQRDADYAAHCIALARRSSSPEVRAAAERLERRRAGARPA